MASGFVPLHVHTQYSLLDGASRISDLCKKAADSGMPGLAVTDHGTMYGTFELVQEAKKNGIKPIIGCEVYVINADHTERKKCRLYHLVLLAKNDVGYKNLIKIVSEACLKGFYYKPRISKAFIKEHSEGIIALSACLGGEVNNNCINQVKEVEREVNKEAEDAAAEYKEIFGEDFYLEIQDHNYPEDRVVNRKVVKLADRLGCKIVATNDNHYTNSEDAKAHDALLCLQMQKYVADYPRMRFSGTEYLKTQDEMLKMFQDHLDPEVIRKAVTETPMEIFNKITDNYKAFDESTMHMPKVDLPKGHSYETYLKELSFNYAKEKFVEITPEIEERLNYELKIMNDSGFASYFIVVWDFIKWAREKGIPVGPGRGSAAGSLVAFVLGITNIDPLKYDLLFERFLNPERKAMPDIDTDFCIDRREEVIEYVKEKYGEDNVCQIITFNKMTSRAVIKDMARVLEYPYGKAEQLAKMIPVVRGKPRKISWMLENHSEFAREYKNDPEARQVIDLALTNEGINKSYGVHAAGVIISDVSVNEVIPIAKSKDGSALTQFAMEECASMGLIKMDFLGLRNLTMIKRAVDIIDAYKAKQLDLDVDSAEFKDKKLDIDQIPLDDKDTFDTVSSGNLSGIFQLETSGGMRQVARDLSPNNLEDISALIALYRPGPLDTGMIDDFINRKSGKEKIKYDHPLLEPILRNTYGTIVYQEQIMQIVQSLGGFSLGEADLLRRAMGKKKPEVLLPYKDKFLEGCKVNAQPVSVELGEKLFDQMLAFAEYCFNKSHSTAYGMVTYQTAYLKTHYPVEYLTSLFIATSGDTDKIRFYLNEAERLDIKVDPPDVNKSELDFKADVAGRRIVFGLSAIKGVGAGAVEELVRTRESGGDFKDFFDFCKRVDQKIITKRTTEGLIKCGAMDSLGVGRKAMLDNLESFMEKAKRKKEEEDKGQTNLFALMGSGDSDDSANFDIVPKFINGPDDEFPERETQAMEYDLLGLYVNNHPMAAMKQLTKIIAKNSISQCEKLPDGAKVTFTALMSGITKKLTKANKLIAILNLEDTEARIEGVVFSSKLEQFESLLEKGNRLLIEGTVSKRSEGEVSVMVNSVESLEELTTVEIDIDISHVNDSFQLLHSLRSFIIQPQNKGKHAVLVNFRDRDKVTKVALGKNFMIEDNEFIREGINKIIKEFTQSEAAQAIA